MKKLIILTGLILISAWIFAQNTPSITYQRTNKSGSAYIQYDTLVTPVGTDTIFEFEGYCENPFITILDFRTADANDMQVDIGCRGRNMDTVFISLDTLVFPMVLDTTIFIDKVFMAEKTYGYYPAILLKLTRGSASDSLKFPIELITPK